MARVLVTDAARGSAISIIRSLGRRGIAVVAADSDPRAPGLKSRYAERSLVYPRPAEDPAATVESLLAAAREHAVDLIIPVTDDVILPLTQARERFDGVCDLALADPEALATASDKLATLELARRLGIPTPRTALVTTAAEAAREAEGLGWPVVLKPRVSRGYADGAVAAYNVEYADRPETACRADATLRGPVRSPAPAVLRRRGPRDRGPEPRAAGRWPRFSTDACARCRRRAVPAPSARACRSTRRCSATRFASWRS